MGCSELWLTYVQTSRGDKPCTAQLIDLSFQSPKLCDLEDLLEHVFDSGYLDAKYRPVSWWERADGSKVPGSTCVEDVVKGGVGLCETTALRLVIADAPSHVWFSYVYKHQQKVQHANAHVTQRIKLHEAKLAGKCDVLAHLTNYIFAKGYLPVHLRSKVYWQGPCGRRVHEHEHIDSLLGKGEGVNESECLQLVIDF